MQFRPQVCLRQREYPKRLPSPRPPQRSKETRRVLGRTRSDYRRIRFRNPMQFRPQVYLRQRGYPKDLPNRQHPRLSIRDRPQQAPPSSHNAYQPAAKSHARHTGQSIVYPPPPYRHQPPNAWTRIENLPAASALRPSYGLECYQHPRPADQRSGHLASGRSWKVSMSP